MKTSHALISETCREQFVRDGYCIVDNLWLEKEIAEIEGFFEEYKEQGQPLFNGLKFAEVDKTKTQVRVMQPHRSCDKALGWFINPRVASVLEELLGKPPLGAQTMYYFKPPGAKGQGMHQDNFYLLAAPAACIAAWTAIDDADLDNGCLYVVPGSHTGEILCPDGSGERWFDYGDSHISKFPREVKPVPVPVKRGQTLFFGGHLIHGSGPNRTPDRFRRTFIAHYVDEATETLSKFYHPVLDMDGRPVSGIEEFAGGGPCGDNWRGATH